MGDGACCDHGWFTKAQVKGSRPGTGSLDTLLVYYKGHGRQLESCLVFPMSSLQGQLTLLALCTGNGQQLDIATAWRSFRRTGWELG